MEFRGNFLSKWNFSGISFGGLLARIAEYSLNGSPREVTFHKGGEGGKGDGEELSVAIVAREL
jgi:hypothetical protein